MLVQQLSLSHKCLASIGNSLNLEEMMKEVIFTFVKETYATYGVCYLLDDDSFVKIASTGRSKKFNVIDYKDLPLEYKIVKHSFSAKTKVLIFTLEKGVLYFVYENNNIDLNFVGPMFFNLKKKIDMSINACINVDLLENKNEILKEKTLKLEELTLNLQEKIDKAVAENKEKEKLIHEQAKMVQMGELMGNIAHQWRQPLTVISTVASGMQLHHEHGILTPEEIIEFTDNIMKQAQYLSKTIDDFREYKKNSEKYTTVNLKYVLEDAIDLVSDAFKKNNITIFEDNIVKEDLFVTVALGNFIEILLILFDNSKDALESKDIENRWVKYSIQKEENMALISIEDNAGGIPSNLVDKIFAPYFTTKHESQGTGIGLYFSYEMIVNQFAGNFYVKNTQNGAKFFIEIPIRK